MIKKNNFYFSVIFSIFISVISLIYLKKQYFYNAFVHPVIPYSDLVIHCLLITLITSITSILTISKKVNKILFFVFLLAVSFFLKESISENSLNDPINIFTDYSKQHFTDINIFYLIFTSSIFLLFLILLTNKIHNFICILIYFLLTFYLINYVPFNDAYSVHEGGLNIGVTFLPIINNFLGGFPPIDTQSQYGYYAYFLTPILKLTGLSILSITMTFTLIYIFCFICIHYFINYFIKNNYLTALIITVSIFINIYFGYALPGSEFYFQYRPVRMLAPCLLLFLFYLYITKFNSHKFKFLIIITLSFLIIWNVDSGIPALLAFIIGDFFNYLFLRNNISLKKKIINLSIILLQYLLLIFSVFILFIAYLYLNTGEILTFSIFFEPHITWSSGKNFFHAWSLNQPVMISCLLNSLGIIYAINKGIKGEWNNKSYGILLLSITSMGLSTYGVYHPTPGIISSFLIPILYILLIYKNLNKKFLNDFLYLSPIIFLSSFAFTYPINNTQFNNPGLIDYYLLKNNKTLFKKHPGNEKYYNLFPNSFRYITINEYVENKNNPKYNSQWMNKLNIISQREYLSCQDNNKKILFLSMNDYQMNIKTNCKTPLRYINLPHLFIYNQKDKFSKKIQNHDYDLIVIDDTQLLRSFGYEDINDFFILIDEEYKLKESIFVDWQLNWITNKYQENYLLVYEK